MKRLLRKYLPPDDYIQRIRDREEAKDFDRRFAFLDDGFGEPYADTGVLPDFPRSTALPDSTSLKHGSNFCAAGIGG